MKKTKLSPVKKFISYSFPLSFIVILIYYMLLGLSAKEILTTKPLEVKPSRVTITPAITPTTIPTVMPTQAVYVTPKPAREYAGGNYAILNSYRVAHGTRPLSRNAALEQSANNRAYRIATGADTWSHDQFFRIYNFYNPKHNDIGENLGRNYTTFDAVMAGWDASPSHKQTMLEPFCEVGIGHYGNVWVLHFGIDNDVKC